MINKNTLRAITPLIDTFGQCDRMLVPAEESILSAIMSTSNKGLVYEYQGDVGFHEEWVKSLRRSTVYGTEEPIKIHDPENGSTMVIPAELHEKTMTEAVKIVSHSVVRAVNYTKTVVKPTIDDFLERLDENLEIRGTTHQPYDIVPVDQSDAWESRVIQMALEPFTATGKPVIVERSAIPKIEIDESLDKMTTGNKRLDEALDKILKGKMLTRTDIAKRIFHGFDNVGSFSTYARQDGELYLASFIIVNMFADNPPSVKMSLDAWNTLVLRLSQAYGALCGLHQRNMAEFRRSGNLVLGLDLTVNRVFLDGKNYDEWLATGGTVERVMGALLFKRTTNAPLTLNVKDLDENREKYNISYNRFKSSADFAERERRIVRVRQALSKAFGEVINGLDLSKMPEGCNKEGMLKDGLRTIKELPDYKLNDFGMLGTKLICDTIYPYTSSLQIIATMSGHIDSGMDVEEAERAMVLDYVSDWCLSAIHLS